MDRPPLARAMSQRRRPVPAGLDALQLGRDFQVLQPLQRDRIESVLVADVAVDLLQRDLLCVLLSRTCSLGLEPDVGEVLDASIRHPGCCGIQEAIEVCGGLGGVAQQGVEDIEGDGLDPWLCTGFREAAPLPVRRGEGSRCRRPDPWRPGPR